MQKLLIALTCILALVATPAAAQAGSIAELAASSNQTTILLAAVQAAGLDEVLSDPELVATVFAPTDDAFLAAIEALNTTAEALLANTDLLTDVLTYHVVPGAAVFAADLVPGQVFPSLLSGPTGELQYQPSAAGEPELLTTSGQMAGIIATDLAAGAAVVHLIDEVLLPGDMFFSAMAPAPAP